MTSAAYDAFADRLLADGILTDPWVDGQPRFCERPVVITQGEQASLYRAAEQVAAAVDEACRMCDGDATLVEGFLGLTPFQSLMWQASRPLWHGMARADVFVTEAGPVVCELNSDTPTGQPEAVVLNQLTAGAHPDLVDPNEGLHARVLGLLEAFADSALGVDEPLSVGIVYPTEITEDLALIRLYRRWFEGAGWSVVLGSPFNITRGDDGRLRLFDTPVQAVLRHYKTDWWSERRPVFDDEAPPADAQPLAHVLHALLSASLEQHCVVVNPFGAVVAQNKRLFALMTELFDAFTPRSQQAIRRYVPETYRLEALERSRLERERDDWVLKSDYGAEGDEVIVGRFATPTLWAESLEKAAPGRWVAQRYFAARTDADGASINHGVYVVGGEACGLYARVQRGPTDGRALSAPLFVRHDTPTAANGTIASASTP